MVEAALGRAFSSQLTNDVKFGHASNVSGFPQARVGPLSSSSGIYHTVSGNSGYVPVYTTEKASIGEAALGRAFSSQLTNDFKFGQASFVTESRGQSLHR